jgi:transposase
MTPNRIAGCFAPLPSSRSLPDAEHGGGLRKTRWAVDRSIAWLHQFRRLKIRHARRNYLHETFLTLRCILIC